MAWICCKNAFNCRLVNRVNNTYIQNVVLKQRVGPTHCAVEYLYFGD